MSICVKNNLVTSCAFSKASMKIFKILFWRYLNIFENFIGYIYHNYLQIVSITINLTRSRVDNEEAPIEMDWPM